MTGLMTLALAGMIAQAAPSARPQAANDPAVLQVFATQVALDRAGFSVGVIDGKAGTNTNKALDAYRAREGKDVEVSSEPLIEYVITDQDAAGPFTPQIPEDLVEQSKLTALEYTAADEAIAERFHTTPAVLRRLNPSATFAAGEAILVPNVEPMLRPVTPPPPQAGAKGDAAKPVGTGGVADRAPVIVTVRKSTSTATVTDERGRTVFFAPVTTGSENDPLPVGEWKINGVQYNPPFRYNPDLFWDADPSHTKATIPPGPNGPVGLVWIDVSKEHYGLHGTPEPSTIGRTQSHGCVRLTNWDALRLAALVGPGTKVVFEQ
jgi:lipoprotein-anchoring transpeptidase ErfK/SrfK